MVKVKVISVFKDKDTKEIYPLDKEMTVSKERYEEIKDYVEIIKTTKNDNNQEAED
ncbi:MAG: hypothetical protein IJ068_06840 [Bacilli bacterium]|nr:hypothetical protein [Bacilli bacterium]